MLESSIFSLVGLEISGFTSVSCSAMIPGICAQKKRTMIYNRNKSNKMRFQGVLYIIYEIFDMALFEISLAERCVALNMRQN